MSGDRRRLPGAKHRLLWGYAPLVVLVVAVLAMVVIVPSRAPGQAAAGDAGTAAEVGVGQTASGWGTSVTACPDREKQADSAYAPPCFDFTGDNGGATSRGVTADTIKVAYRNTTDPNLLKLLADFGGIELDETNQELLNTAQALVEYFNNNYQFYGRKLELVGYDGIGSLLSEFTGSGLDAANTDAVKVADELGAFADVTGITQPYAEALARNQVVNIGAPYMSREWYQQRRPYSWSNFPDCTAVSEASAEYSNKRLFGRPAQWAEGDLKDKDRTLAVVAPNNLEYQQCVDSFEKGIEKEGNKLTLRLDYLLDVAQLKTEASSIMAKIKESGVTSVSCACDPIMQMYLAQEATAIGYTPEWLIAGVGFIDLDLGGQIIAHQAGDQWDRAFGGSPWAASQPPQSSDAYKAYRSVRDDEPSELVEILYAQMLSVALGVQMAGPDLTPETFETGLFAYPPATGQTGLWDFGEGQYTPVRDIREIWFDPDAVSAFNDQKGSYVDNGIRWPQGEIPEGDPEVFK
jgi:Periplasmic binding protein